MGSSETDVSFFTVFSCVPCQEGLVLLHVPTFLHAKIRDLFDMFTVLCLVGAAIPAGSQPHIQINRERVMLFSRTEVYASPNRGVRALRFASCSSYTAQLLLTSYRCCRFWGLNWTYRDKTACISRALNPNSADFPFGEQVFRETLLGRIVIPKSGYHSFQFAEHQCWVQRYSTNKRN